MAVVRQATRLDAPALSASLPAPGQREITGSITFTKVAFGRDDYLHTINVMLEHEPR